MKNLMMMQPPYDQRNATLFIYLLNTVAVERMTRRGINKMQRLPCFHFVGQKKYHGEVKNNLRILDRMLKIIADRDLPQTENIMEIPCLRTHSELTFTTSELVGAHSGGKEV